MVHADRRCDCRTTHLEKYVDIILADNLEHLVPSLTYPSKYEVYLAVLSQLHSNGMAFNRELWISKRQKNMRKIIVLSMISLDGVMQAPGGPKEDTSGGFRYGGWTVPYGDEIYNTVVQKELAPADYLLGRKTFEIWAHYWPEHGDFWPGINEGTKYVLSKSLKKSDPLITGWKNAVLVKNVAAIKKLKGAPGGDIHVWGSSGLVHLLLKNDLVDELRLKIHPLTLGKGKKLFGDGAIPAAFTLTEHTITSTGVIIAYYQRAGKVETGNAG